MMKRWLITGATGLLSDYLIEVCARHGAVTTTARSGGDRHCDLTDSAAVRSLLTDVAPDVVIHAAGLTDVERCEREPHLLKQGSGYVLYALMDAVVDRYFPILELLQNELDDIEERIFVRGAARVNIERLYRLKRKLMLLDHAVSSLLQFSGKLYGGRVPAVCAHNQPYFRDISDHLARIDNAIDSIRETIGTAIMVNLSTVAIEEGEITKRLAAWAAIFAVATAFAGIWGMNFDHMPELKLKWGYPAALGLITGSSLFLWWRFRRSGWL